MNRQRVSSFFALRKLEKKRNLCLIICNCSLFEPTSSVFSISYAMSSITVNKTKFKMLDQIRII